MPALGRAADEGSKEEKADSRIEAIRLAVYLAKASGTSEPTNLQMYRTYIPRGAGLLAGFACWKSPNIMDIRRAAFGVVVVAGAYGKEEGTRVLGTASCSEHKARNSHHTYRLLARPGSRPDLDDDDRLDPSCKHGAEHERKRRAVLGIPKLVAPNCMMFNCHLIDRRPLNVSRVQAKILRSLIPVVALLFR